MMNRKVSNIETWKNENFKYKTFVAKIENESTQECMCKIEFDDDHLTYFMSEYGDYTVVWYDNDDENQKTILSLIKFTKSNRCYCIGSTMGGDTVGSENDNVVGGGRYCFFGDE